MEVQRHGDIDWERYKPQILNSSFGGWYNSQLLQLDCAAHTKYTDQVSNGDRNADQTARDEVTGPVYTVIEETTHRWRHFVKDAAEFYEIRPANVIKQDWKSNLQMTTAQANPPPNSFQICSCIEPLAMHELIINYW